MLNLRCSMLSHWGKKLRTMELKITQPEGKQNLVSHYIPLTNRLRGLYRKLRTEFFPLRFMARALRAWAINRRGRGGGWGSVAYSKDREDEVSKIFIISLLCVWRVRERFLSMRNGFKYLKQVESKTSQSEIVFKSSARFGTQFRVKESFKPLLAQ